ncbi:MAG: hypothetical protein DHS20C02_13950 [Micavibrio sp.]|nr:MAG: hypothetical protein DHS20C02_13950 [Micavibrio sp.]
MGLGFNEESEKPWYKYKRNPLVEHSFQIFGFVEKKQDYEPVGEYTVLDPREDPDLTEKKMMNIISLLNGKKDLMELGNLTKTRLLYNMVPKTSESDKTKIIFRTYDLEGVSMENAVLELKKGVLNDESSRQTDSG